MAKSKITTSERLKRTGNAIKEIHSLSKRLEDAQYNKEHWHKKYCDKCAQLTLANMQFAELSTLYAHTKLELERRRKSATKD